MTLQSSLEIQQASVLYHYSRHTGLEVKEWHGLGRYHRWSCKVSLRNIRVTGNACLPWRFLPAFREVWSQVAHTHERHARNCNRDTGCDLYTAPRCVPSGRLLYVRTSDTTSEATSRIRLGTIAYSKRMRFQPSRTRTKQSGKGSRRPNRRVLSPRCSG